MRRVYLWYACTVRILFIIVGALAVEGMRGTCLVTDEALAASPESAKPEAPARLEPVVVSAGRVEQALQDVPANVTVVTRDDIERSAARTVDDLLRQIPGFSLFRRELYRQFRVQNVVTLANSDLGPERLTGGEVGLDYVLGERRNESELGSFFVVDLAYGDRFRYRPPLPARSSWRWRISSTPPMPWGRTPQPAS